MRVVSVAGEARTSRGLVKPTVVNDLSSTGHLTEFDTLDGSFVFDELHLSLEQNEQVCPVCTQCRSVRYI
jgi:hypothetical protein